MIHDLLSSLSLLSHSRAKIISGSETTVENLVDVWCFEEVQDGTDDLKKKRNERPLRQFPGSGRVREGHLRGEGRELRIAAQKMAILLKRRQLHEVALRGRALRDFLRLFFGASTRVFLDDVWLSDWFLLPSSGFPLI